MGEDQFTKLFKYMQTEFASIRQEIQAVRTDVQGVYNVTFRWKQAVSACRRRA